jgi:transcriptional regulator with XRE-family HTH domain
MASWNEAVEPPAVRRRQGLSPASRGRSPVNAAASKQNERDEIDRRVGRRIRLRRIMLGLTQEVIAQKLQITLNQIHKYERGATRISAARLWQFAEILDVSVDFFFEAQEQNGASGNRERQFLELARNFERMENDQQRSIILKVARALAESATDRRDARLLSGSQVQRASRPEIPPPSSRVRR